MLTVLNVVGHCAASGLERSSCALSVKDLQSITAAFLSFDVVLDRGT